MTDETTSSEDDNVVADDVERQPAPSRKKQRSSEGRERYLDMVQRERAMMLEQGIARSAERLLDMAGALLPSEQEDEAIKDMATGDQLRAILPVQAWLPLSIHLIGLRDGVLRIAPLHDLKKMKTDGKSVAAAWKELRLLSCHRLNGKMTI